MLVSTWVALAAVALVGPAAASPGDNLDEFHNCLFQCHQISCYHNPYYITQHQYRKQLRKKKYQFSPYEPRWKFDTSVAPHLKLLLWDCKSNCDYQCQRIVTRERVQRGEPVYQFHGKWPFLRVLGVQEFVSAALSVANFVPHYIGYRKVKEVMRNNPPEKRVLNRSYRNIKLMAFVTMCAWTFSTIFHIRDFIFTERLDYFFAGLTVLTGFYGIGYRYYQLYLPRRRLWAWAFALACMGAYAYHVHRLVTDWSYTYNMQANIFIGVLQNVLWVLACYDLYSRYYDREQASRSTVSLTHLSYVQRNRIIKGSFFARSPKIYSIYPLLLCFIVVMGMSLEVWDFPPVLFDLVDAHSLWHLVTVFPAFLGWYDWMIWDINENVWDDMRAAAQKKEQ